jgi:hypothetical protein
MGPKAIEDCKIIFIITWEMEEQSTVDKLPLSPADVLRGQSTVQVPAPPIRSL